MSFPSRLKIFPRTVLGMLWPPPFLGCVNEVNEIQGKVVPYIMLKAYEKQRKKELNHEK